MQCALQRRQDTLRTYHCLPLETAQVVVFFLRLMMWFTTNNINSLQFPSRAARLFLSSNFALSFYFCHKFIVQTIIFILTLVLKVFFWFHFFAADGTEVISKWEGGGKKVLGGIFMNISWSDNAKVFLWPFIFFYCIMESFQIIN